jgi:hypothetical protein
MEILKLMQEHGVTADKSTSNNIKRLWSTPTTFVQLFYSTISIAEKDYIEERVDVDPTWRMRQHGMTMTIVSPPV